MVIFERWYILINSEKIAYLLWARQYAKYQEHAFMKKLQCIKKKKKKTTTMQSLYKGYLKMEYAIIYSEWLCYTVD